MKRIVTMQDLSCVGKCSLSLALPAISAMGVECTVLPTAVLSAHAAFPSPVAEPLDDFALRTVEYWEKLDFPVDGILTGYLAYPAQTRLAGRLMEALSRDDPQIFVDPAMADQGRLYRGTAEEMIPAMTALCARATVAMPNLTEAALMTGLPFRAEGERSYLRELAAGLREKGVEQVLLTGAGTGDRVGVYWACGAQEAELLLPREDRSCHGTGDLFAAVCCAGSVLGMELPRAGLLAAEFVGRAIRATPRDRDSRYGVCFEQELGWLAAETAKRV